MSASTTKHTLRVLHLSDLHERVSLGWMPEDRKLKIRLGLAKRHRVLGPELTERLTAIAKEQPPDLLVFTGDIADFGLDEEYVAAKARLMGVLRLLGLGWDRVFLVPGNHDINRKEEPTCWAEMRRFAEDHHNRGRLNDWLAGISPPQGAPTNGLDLLAKRQSGYGAFVQNIERPELLPDGSRGHPRLGYRQTLALPGLPPVHIIGLDTAWLAGDDNDKGRLLLTEHQVLQNATNLANGQPLDGLRLALMHHPLSDLGDEALAHRLLSNHVDLVLHGHQHTAEALYTANPDRTLRTLAAGSLYEGDEGDKWVNSFNVIDIEMNVAGEPLQYVVQFYAWAPTSGHWHHDSALYKKAEDGRLVWEMPPGQAQPRPATTAPISANSVVTSEAPAENTKADDTNRAVVRASDPTAPPRSAPPERPLTRRWHVRSSSDEQTRQHARTEYTTEELERFDTVVMLGEPGTGKSFELNHLVKWATQDHLAPRCVLLRSVSCESALRELLRDTVEQVRQDGSTLTLYLDALDEDRTALGDLVAAVVNTIDWLVDRLGERLRLRITCRNAHWPERAERMLQSRLRPQIVQLQSLTEDEALLLATAQLQRQRVQQPEAHAARLLSALAQRGAADFASAPITLLMVCRYGDGELPVRRIDLFQAGLKQLATEHEDEPTKGLRHIVNPETALRIAANLAALTTFSTWGGVPLRGASEGLDLGGLAQRLGVEVKDVVAVAKSALFADARRGPLGPVRELVQQSFADFLAAWWLAHEAHPEAWEHLLWNDGAINLRHQSVAEWLAFMENRLWSRLLEERPELLLTPDLPTATSDQRADLLDALMSFGAGRRIFSRQRLIVERAKWLTLVGAESRLMQRLSRIRSDTPPAVGTKYLLSVVAGHTLRELERRATGSPTARELVLLLVKYIGERSGHLGHTSGAWASGALVSGLGLVIYDPQFSDRERSRWWDELVGPLVDRLDDHQDLKKLPATEHEERADCHADVMNLLFPRWIGTEELRHALYPPRALHFGRYDGWHSTGLATLAMDDADLLLLLMPDWFENYDSRLDGNFNSPKLRWEVILRHLNNEGVWREYVRYVQKICYERAWDWRPPVPEERRRDLLVDVLRLVVAKKQGLARSHDWLDPLPDGLAQLIQPEDASWCLPRLARANEEECRVYRLILYRLLNRPEDRSKTLLQELRAVWANLPETQREALWTLAWLRDDESIAKREAALNAKRTAHEEDEMRWKREHPSPENEPPPPSPSLAELLAPHADVTDQWIRLTDVLYGHQQLIDWGAQLAVTLPEAWSSRSEEERAQVEEVARRFLEEGAPVRDSLEGNLYWTDVGLLAAMRLLLALRDGDSAPTLGLDVSIWKRWAPSILYWALHLLAGWSPSGQRMVEALMSRLAEIVPGAPRSLQPLLRSIDNDRDAEKLVKVLLWGSPAVIDKLLVDGLNSDTLSPVVEIALLRELTPRNDRVGRAAFRRCVHHLKAGPTQSEPLWRIAGFAALKSPTLDEATWQLVLPWLDDEENLREARSTLSWFDEPGRSLSEARVGQVIERLYRRLQPEVPDQRLVSPGERLTPTLGPLDGFEHPRSSLDILVRRNTPAALAELWRLYRLFEADDIYERAMDLADSLHMADARMTPPDLLAQRRYDT